MSSLHSSHPAGVQFARFARALAVAKGDLLGAEAFAVGQNWDRTTPAVPMAIKSLIEPLDHEALSGLRIVGRDFAEYLRPRTILGRLQGLRRVPFKVRMVSAGQGSGAAWVGQASPIPVSAMTLNDAGEQLLPLKAGGIAVITSELARHSAPVADALVAADVGAAIAAALDVALVDPASGGVADVKPASITYDAQQFESSGSGAAAIDADLALMLGTLTDANLSLETAAWIMAPKTATSLSLKRNGDGGPAFPGMTARGGTLCGLPVITSRACEASGSPGERFIVLAEAGEILLADDGESEISVSGDAALQMDDAPAADGQQLVSLWQNGLVGVRGLRWMNWKRRRAGCVACLRSVAF